MKRDVLTDIARNVRIAVQISWRYSGLLSYITTRLLRWPGGFKCVQCGLESGLLYFITRHNFKNWMYFIFLSVLSVNSRERFFFFFFFFCYFLPSFLCHLLSLFLPFFFIFKFFGILFCLHDTSFLHYYARSMSAAEEKMGQVARGGEWWSVGHKQVCCACGWGSNSWL